MTKNRLEAFSDGVLAIVITIMVLELKVPHGIEWSDLGTLTPVFLTYILSFLHIGIYWNNHHHLLHATGRINGAILWANMHLLFWLSLVPFVTGWMGENHFAQIPTIAYCAVLLASSIAYYVLQRCIQVFEGPDSKLHKAVGKETKGRISTGLYTVGIIAGFWNHWITLGLIIFVALMWVVPDKRIERVVE